jgi:hypothetical protein
MSSVKYQKLTHVILIIDHRCSQKPSHDSPDMGRTVNKTRSQSDKDSLWKCITKNSLSCCLLYRYFHIQVFPFRIKTYLITKIAITMKEMWIYVYLDVMACPCWTWPGNCDHCGLWQPSQLQKSRSKSVTLEQVSAFNCIKCWGEYLDISWWWKLTYWWNSFT